MYLKIAKFFLYVSLFSVLIVLPWLYFPYIVGKAVFFRSAIDLAIIFFTLYWALEKGDRRGKEEAGSRKENFLRRIWREQPLLVAVAVFAVAFVLSCLFGINPWFSFWSNFERGEGGFQILHYVALFFLATAIFKKESDWTTVFKVMVVISLLVGLYGVVAASPFLPHIFIGPTGFLSRMSGTLGNADYAGTFMLFAIFYALYLLLAKKRQKDWVRMGLMASVILFLSFMLLSQTRGAIVGLGAGMLAFLLYTAFKAERGTKTRKWLMAVLVAFVVLAGAFFAAQRVLDKINNCSVCDRYLHISVNATTFKTRFWAWEAAFEGWKNRPVFGWGPEEYSAVFDKYFNTNYYDPTVSGSETWFDRAHSIYFDYLAETGAVGLLAYLSIFAVFFWQFFKRTNRPVKEDHEHRGGAPLTLFQKGLLLAMPVAYLVQGIVLFDVLPTYINVMLFLAFADYEFQKYGSGS
ncbi:MAG: O-antigen ligase family protein [Patescibacteria group bacterium]|nr:O-antigen ligase family protein [Patescibacteria group bacterium]